MTKEKHENKQSLRAAICMKAFYFPVNGGYAGVGTLLLLDEPGGRCAHDTAGSIYKELQTLYFLCMMHRKESFLSVLHHSSMIMEKCV